MQVIVVNERDGAAHFAGAGWILEESDNRWDIAWRGSWHAFHSLS
jgi:hypothetical protein